MSIGRAVLDFLISPPTKKYRWVNLAFLALLFIAGLYAWGRFLNWGRGNLSFHDWAYITLPRLTFLKDAVTRGLLPLHTANTEALGGITTRFMAIPDVILSPQIILLRFLNLGRFLIINVGLLYALGFIGLLVLRRRYGLSNLAFMAIFLFFNFNGHILAHISVGHFNWVGSFLFSWFALLVFELLESKTDWRWVAKFSVLLFVILLQGSYHQFVWCILFMCFLAVFSIKHIVPIAKGVGFALLISMVRILPPFILLGKFDNQFIAGYHDALSMFSSLLHFQSIYSPIGLLDPSAGLSVWEWTIFIGVIGTFFLFYFGMWRPISNPADNQRKVILLPALCLAFLSLDRVYLAVRTLLPLPILTGERISSRMVYLAVIMLLILATIEFQSWLNGSRSSKLVLMVPILLLLLAINDLWQNFTLWSVTNVKGGFPEQGYDPTQWFVANDWSDRPYLTLILIGSVVTILSLAFLIYKSLKANQPKAQNIAQAP